MTSANPELFTVGCTRLGLHKFMLCYHATELEVLYIILHVCVYVSVCEREREQAIVAMLKRKWRRT